MIIIKMLFLLASLSSRIFCIIQLNKLPDEKFVPEGNYGTGYEFDNTF